MVTATQKTRFQRIFQRASETAIGVDWCCQMHANAAYEILHSQMQVFKALKARDANGYKLILQDLTEYLETLENLAVLMHPAINVGPGYA